MEQYVVFKSHQQLFALRIDYVVRVIEAASFTQLPEVADFVLGIQPFEEAMVPIIDIRKKLFDEFTPLVESPSNAELNTSGLKQNYIEAFLKKDDELVLALELPFLFSYEQAAEMTAELDAYQTEELAAANDHDNDDRE
jgi:purine-binding chemotaxis protein CheW